MAVDPALGPPDLGLEEAQHALEERVRRLEDAVASLQEQQARSAENIRTGLPPQVKIGAPHADFERGPAESITRVRSPWLLHELLADLAAIWRMFFDHRYRVAWSTWLAVICIVPLILTSGWWFLPAHIPAVGEILEKVMDFVLAFFLYKALSREARRYREFCEPITPGRS